tara:strand:- start:240 stop:455 length:216 start_codon:yes stop_codon:yes gene_type:complete
MAHKYIFSEIPNDDEGRLLVKLMRKHLNREGYRLKLRGQYLKDGLNWRLYTHGQPISKSKNLRIYIEPKEL